MRERPPTPDETSALVPWCLVAEAAGISERRAARIAREIAMGQRAEWLGANVEVRTVTRGQRIDRYFVIPTLPAAIRAELETDHLRFRVAAQQAISSFRHFRAAAEQPLPGTELAPEDFLVLHAAARDCIAPELFGHLIDSLTAGGPLLLASRARFELVTDYLFGYGLRSSFLPAIGPDYIAFLMEARQQISIEPDEFYAMLEAIDDTDTLAELSGHGFLKVLMHLDQNHGLCLLPPRRHYTNRTIAGQIHHAAYRLNLAYAEHLNVLIRFGGGCYRVSQLDHRGARRVLAHYLSHGYQPPEPPPRVAAAPGFISQAQANLIWKLWHDFAKPGADVSEAALTAVLFRQLGIEGGLHALTAAGAGRVLDHMLAPIVAHRLQSN